MIAGDITVNTVMKTDYLIEMPPGTGIGSLGMGLGGSSYLS